MWFQALIFVFVSTLVLGCGSKRESGSGTIGSGVGPSGSGSCGSDLACDMHSFISGIRKDNGLEALPTTAACQKAAQAHAEDMANNEYFSHTGLDGSSPTDRFRRFGGSSGAGENIALSSANVEATADLWMNSSGHRANILSTDYQGTGIGFAEGRENAYWVQCFEL